jgi:hypothetical protein
MSVEPYIRTLRPSVGNMQHSIIKGVAPFLLKIFYSSPEMKQELELTA